MFFFSNYFGLLDFCANLVEPFHALCSQMAPSSEFHAAYSALVCGSNLPPSQLRESLQTTSLLHLAIVSGSHLLLLESMAEKILRKSPHKNSIIATMLFIYSLLTGWQAPAIRAVVGRWLNQLALRFHLHWSPLQTTWYTGWLTWALFPAWSQSFSLLLSWAASLSLAMASQFNTDGFRQEWKIHLLVYLSLVPLLLPFSPPHPFSILCNWLIGPLLGVLLFPLSLLAFLIPAVTPLCDMIWQISADIVIWASQWTPANSTKVQTPILLLWSYLLILNILAMTVETLLKRKNACLSKQKSFA